MIATRRLAFAASLFALLGTAGDALAVDSAADVCAPATDPCIISNTVLIDDGATLDFGTRTLQVQGGGQLDTGAGAGIVKCGRFILNTGTALGLKVRGPSGFGSTDGGNLVMDVYRRCSTRTTTRCIKDSECDFGTCTSQVCDLDPNRLCLDDDSCVLGNCGVTVCSRDAERECGNDIACDIGPCNLTTRRCAQDSGVVCFSNSQCNFGPCALSDPRCEGDLATSCSNNGDCNFGTCDVPVCNKKEGDVYRQCGGDGDCFDGACTLGDGSVTLNGRSRADGAEPGSISIRAAGDINVQQTLQLDASNAQFDGGFLELESGKGAVTQGAAISARGGGQSQGGEVSLIAGTNVTINEPIDCNGGDFDGGFIEFIAGNDLLINDNLLASSTAGAGLGGEIDVSADRDIIIGATSQLLTNGHQSVDNFGGDGGPQSFFAGRNISLGSGARIEATGSAPDGFGEDVYFESDGNTNLAGGINVEGRGTQSAGGSISTDVGGALVVQSTATLDATGAASGGGAIDLFATGNITFAGLVDGQATGGGSPDSVLMVSESDLAMTGDVLLNGGPAGTARGDVEIEACRVTLNSGSLISNLGGGGTNTLIGRERVTVNTGASIVTASNGTNLVRYRAEDKPPVLAGTISPAAQLEVVPGLVGCPICGNSEVEGGESCDDGNLTGGDGCSSNCQDEGCIADTPGYPSVPLCDDAQDCTVDTCNGDTHSCEHVLDCEDGNECTVDTCANETCVHVKDNALCDDDNPCTADICGTFGCTYAISTGPCTDGLSCTTGDTCVAGDCQGTDTCPDGQLCSSESGICEEEGGGCGDPTNDGRTTASDALFALNVAVGLQTCAVCVCDVDNSAATSASDALRLLNFAVGIPGVALNCPAC
jgi:hypothetical protein